MLTQPAAAAPAALSIPQQIDSKLPAASRGYRAPPARPLRRKLRHQRAGQNAPAEPPCAAMLSSSSSLAPTSDLACGRFGGAGQKGAQTQLAPAAQLIPGDLYPCAASGWPGAKHKCPSPSAAAGGCRRYRWVAPLALNQPHLARDFCRRSISILVFANQTLKLGMRKAAVKLHQQIFQHVRVQSIGEHEASAAAPSRRTATQPVCPAARWRQESLWTG